MAGDYIKIRVAGKGPVRRYVGEEEALVPPGSTASLLAGRFRIPAEMPVICMRDGRRMTASAELRDGDSILLITMLSGG